MRGRCSPTRPTAPAGTPPPRPETAGDAPRPGSASDPKLDIHEYLRLARYLGVHVDHILETHNHADHVSGHGRLAAATGATIHCGGPGMDLKVSSTIGFERAAQALLQIHDEDAFVEQTTSGPGPQPPNFRTIVALAVRERVQRSPRACSSATAPRT